MAARTAAAEGEVAWPFCPHSGDGTQRGIADTSSSSVTPALCGHVTVVLQLQELARCGGSHGPVVVLPAPRERSNCHAENRPKRPKRESGHSELTAACVRRNLPAMPDHS